MATYLGAGPDPVVAVSRNVIDGDKSDGDVAVFTSVTCLVWDVGNPAPCVGSNDSKDRLVNAAEDIFATDRRTGLAVADGKYTTANDPHEGLVNKFPFDVEQKTYLFWDGVLGQGVDAVYQGEEDLDGYRAYVFQIDVPVTKTEIASGVDGTYEDQKRMWVDPGTGAILKQTDRQERLLPSGDTALALQLGFTDEQVAANIADARSNASRLSLVGRLPLIALLLSIPALVGGLVLLRRSSGSAQAARPVDDPSLLPGFDDDNASRHARR